MTRIKWKGIIFDLDGVLTNTARIHAQAWEEVFNGFMQRLAERENVPFKPFDPIDDYQKYVDGKPRFEGVLSFLKSRNIDLPYGQADDDPQQETMHGLGNRKNEKFQDLLRKKGPDVFETSVSFVKDLKQRGIRTAVASSSKNCQLVLELAGLDHLFEARIDGLVSMERNLNGKPEPDIFVVASREMGLYPGECAIVEDAISGVQAGRNGNFGFVLGLARGTDGQLLKRFGADKVVQDLAEIDYDQIQNWFEEGILEDSWHITYKGFDPGDEKLRETLTTVGNGYMGTRGCFEGESESFSCYPGTYVAGLFNKVPSLVHGKEIFNNDFVNCPNWLLVEWKIGNGNFASPLSMELLSYAHTLKMHEGIAERAFICKDKLGRITRVQAKHLVSMSDHHLCALVYEITPLNYSAPITIRSSLDGNVQNHGVPRYRQLTSKHWNLIHSETTQDGIHLHVQTTHSKYDLVMYAKTSLQEDCNFIEPEKDVFQDKFKIGEEIQFYAQENSTYALEKIVSVATSLDLETEDYEGLARQKLDSVSSFAQIYEPHIRAWKNLWNKADIQIEGDRFTQRTIRLHIFHLLVTASLHNTEIDAGMPARGLHGEAYRGHIFWDEVYILPFYDLHYPQIVRALLMYRYNRLNAARQYARDNGYEGAMYPWQTADGGDEETQEVHYNPESKTWGPDLSRNQRHISLAVFYNIWRYMKIAQDEEFLHTYGAEIMLEIARCFASMAEYDSETGKYHIDGVMGPDEFHEKFPGREKAGLKDNAYTNVMTSWALEKTVDVLQQLPEEVLKKLESKTGFKQEELQKWKEVSENLNVIIDENNVISQFEGYMDLKELDWEDYRQRYYSIHRMDRILKAEGDSPDNYKVAKQADVLMMFYLLKPEEVKRILNKLGYEIEDAYELLTANYNYYEPRTSHGSTLSKVVHSVVSSFIHVDERPWNWFLEAMQSDIYDTQGGTTQEGIHTGVMAGTIDVILRSFARLDYLKSTVSINPRLPEQWISLMFKILHQDVWYQFEINKKYVRVRADAETTEPTTVKILNKEITLQPGVWNEIGSSCPFIPFTISNY